MTPFVQLVQSWKAVAWQHFIQIVTTTNKREWLPIERPLIPVRPVGQNPSSGFHLNCLDSKLSVWHKPVDIFDPSFFSEIYIYIFFLSDASDFCLVLPCLSSRDSVVSCGGDILYYVPDFSFFLFFLACFSGSAQGSVTHPFCPSRIRLFTPALPQDRLTRIRVWPLSTELFEPVEWGSHSPCKAAWCCQGVTAGLPVHHDECTL